MNKRWRNVGLYVLAVITVIFIGTSVFDKPKTENATKTLRYSDFIEAVQDKEVSRVLLSPDSGTGQVIENDGSRSEVNLAPDKDLLKILTENDVDIAVTPTKLANPWQQAISSLIFPVLLIGGLFFLFRRSQNGSGGGGGNPAMSFGKSKARLQMEPSTQVTFSDVAGVEGAKLELTEVVDFLKSPDRFTAVGAKIPKGVLLVGPPGTGKTLLAKAVAGEAGVPFFSISGSEFVEMFVGVGASRVRDLFEQAKKNAPCIVFIDEIDAVGRQRGAGINSGNDEREQTLNQILTNMDGFTASTGIIVLAATNRADILDDALLRPGRFDRKINVPLPDLEGRKEIFRVHTRDKKLDNNTDINEIAILTTGFSGADICNLANEAAILSVRNNRTRIDRQTILDAYEKITIGLPSLKNTEDESVVKLVSYHEIGHAFMVKYFEEFFDLRKVTINANKGGAGGYTLFTPKQRFMSYPTKKYMLANLVIALGGRAAEVHLYSDNKNRETDVVFKEIKNLDITTGASNDLKQADNIARKYIQLFGLSDDSSLVNNNVESSSQPFLGRELALGGDRISEYSKEKTDKMVCKLITDCYRIALNLIDANPKNFNKLAEKLIKERTLDASDFENLKFKY